MFVFKPFKSPTNNVNKRAY